MPLIYFCFHKKYAPRNAGLGCESPVRECVCRALRRSAPGKGERSPATGRQHRPGRHLRCRQGSPSSPKCRRQFFSHAQIFFKSARLVPSRQRFNTALQEASYIEHMHLSSTQIVTFKLQGGKKRPVYAGFIGNNFLYLLDICKRKILQADCTFLPASATLFCMGVEVLTPKPGGFDFSALDKYRLSFCSEGASLFSIHAAQELLSTFTAILAI